MKKVVVLGVLVSIFFGSAAEDVLPIEGQQQEETEEVPPTFRKRLEYFGRGLGYSLVSAGSLVAVYKCARISYDRATADDPVQEWHDAYDQLGEPKSGDEWNNRIKKARLLKSFYLAACLAYGSLALGIPYLNYKYKIPHKAFENFKKAFQ